MTIWGIFTCVIVTLLLLFTSIYMVAEIDNNIATAIIAVVCILSIIGTWMGASWYFKNTASGQRAVIDQKSELSNGLERIVTVYTADGNIIAQYKGKIDIESNDGGYVIFDFEGKRYMYYNCFVESIANLE